MSCEEPLNPSALTFLSDPLCTIASMSNVPRLLALIDETIRNDPQHGQFYVLTAAIVDKAHPRYSGLWKDFRQVANRQPTKLVHASEIARAPNGHQDLSLLERTIGDNPAVTAIAVVRTPFGPGGEEGARQMCLSDLLAALTSSFGIRHIVMDTRDHLGVATKSMSAKPGTRNYEDIRTIHDLQRVGELPEDLRVVHADDQRMHELWIADVVAYAVGRSLADRDPFRLQWLAPHLQMREARMLPVSQRTDGRWAPDTGLTSLLIDYIARAKLSRNESRNFMSLGGAGVREVAAG